MLARFSLLVIAAAASTGAGAAADPSRYMDVKLVAESAEPRPGSTILLGFRFTPRPGWHGYWSNPGDSGIVPTVRWTAPEGVSFGPLLHPAPTLLTADGLSSFVHEGPHVLLSKMTVDRSLAPGTPIPVKADLRWAACTATQCVPLRATLTLDLVAGVGTESADFPALAAAARKLPRPADGATFTVDGDRLRLRPPETVQLVASRARFFPDQGGIIDAAAATNSVDGGAVTISAVAEGKVPKAIGGVVSDGRNAWRLTFERTFAEPSAPEAQLAKATETDVRTVQPPPIATIPTPETPPEPILRTRDNRVNSIWSWLMLSIVVATGAGVVWARRRRP
jgi:DsbC/DsbD-like thiol-disulfide interchange protein